MNIQNVDIQIICFVEKHLKLIILTFRSAKNYSSWEGSLYAVYIVIISHKMRHCFLIWKVLPKNLITNIKVGLYRKSMI